MLENENLLHHRESILQEIIKRLIEASLQVEGQECPSILRPGSTSFEI
jgi:hypothetical protein